MSEIAAQNLQILQRRWPDLGAQIVSAPVAQSIAWESPAGQPTLSVDGQRLWSAYDAEAEACLQAEAVPPSAERAWVYGIGGGDVIRELLRRPALMQLHVVVMNPGLLHLLLHSLDHRDWLDDPRVSLEDAGLQARPHAPFALIPACLKLCAPAATQLCDQLIEIQVQPFERERLDRMAPQRRRQIRQNLSLVEQDGDVVQLFSSILGGTAYVAIAGPSLAQHAEWLATHRAAGTLLCVDGALGPLLDKGIVPDIVLSVDENRDNILRYFDRDLGMCADRTLVYAPLVHNDVLRRWPGQRLATYTFEAVYDEIRKRLPRAELFVAGSVSHPTVDLAVRMGASRVILFGADFGFPLGRVHANEQAPVAFYANAAKTGEQVLNGHGKPIPTITSFNGYRLGLERYIARHPQVRFMNAGRDGARIHGTQYLDGGAP